MDATDARILSCLSDVPQHIRHICETTSILSADVRRRIAALKELHPELGLRLGRVQTMNGRPHGYVINPTPEARLEMEAVYLKWEEECSNSLATK